MSRLVSGEEVDCPACGRPIAVDAFKAHVAAEGNRLQTIAELFATQKSASAVLADTLKALRSDLSRTEVASWREQVSQTGLKVGLAYLDKLDVEAVRGSSGAGDLAAIEAQVLPLIEAAELASKHVQADVQQLLRGKRMVETARAVLAARDQAAGATRAESLVGFIGSLEQGIRSEIKHRSKAVIDDISADLKTMWGPAPGKVDHF
jgi:hypothetical protein